MEIQELLIGAGGGIIGGSIAWFALFKVAGQYNKQVNDRITALEAGMVACDKDRKEIHAQFNKFQEQALAISTTSIQKNTEALSDLSQMLECLPREIAKVSNNR